MSNALLNAHIEYGRPCGPDADFDQITEWAGNLLLDLAWPNKVTDPLSKIIILHAIQASRNINRTPSDGWITDSVPPPNLYVLCALEYDYLFGTYDHENNKWMSCDKTLRVFAWQYKAPEFRGSKETVPQWDKLPTNA